MKRNPHHRNGFTLLEIMLVVSIIGMLAVIVYPAFFKNREAARFSLCVSNLRILATAKAIFALEERRGNGDPVVAANVNPYLKRPFEQMDEPAGGIYDLQPVGLDPLCTIGHVY